MKKNEAQRSNDLLKVIKIVKWIDLKRGFQGSKPIFSATNWKKRGNYS